MRAEDYWADTAGTLRTVSDFLGVGTPTHSNIRRAASAPIRPLHGSDATFWGDKTVVNRHVALPGHQVRQPGHTHSRVNGTMGGEARHVMSSWFAPYNAALAKALADDRFTWADVLRGSSGGDAKRS